MYQIYAEARATAFGTSPGKWVQAEREALPRKAIEKMIVELLRDAPVERDGRDPRHMAGWHRFLAAFEQADPGVAVMPSARQAQDGQLYRAAWGVRDRTDARAYLMRIKGVVVRTTDMTIFRYRLGIKSRVEPIIQMRAPMRAVFRKYPPLQFAAVRWEGCAKGCGKTWRRKARRNLGTMAVGVYSERVEDFGRACAGLLRDGVLPGITVEDQRIVVSEEAMTWRP